MYSSNQEATIDSVLIHQNGGVQWNVSFVQNFNDWQLDVVAAFLDQLYSHAPANSDNDGLWWCLKKNGLFDTCSFYTAIRDSPVVVFLWKSVWHFKAPRRVFFLYGPQLGRILTCDNLMREPYGILLFIPLGFNGVSQTVSGFIGWLVEYAW